MCGRYPNLATAPRAASWPANPATAQREGRWAIVDLVGNHGRVGAGPITAQGVFEAVVSYARKAGLGKITPHDLRRTFAKLAHQGRALLEQIQISLGHASIQTTERYLGLKQNLHDAPCDRLGIGGGDRGQWGGVGT